MGLDFYVADSIEKINVEDVFVELHEELQEYIYKNKEKVNFKLKCLYGLEPYGDTVIDKDNIIEIMITCQRILKSGFLMQYKDREKATVTIMKLKKLCGKAIVNNQKLIAIGD